MITLLILFTCGEIFVDEDLLNLGFIDFFILDEETLDAIFPQISRRICVFENAFSSKFSASLFGWFPAKLHAHFSRRAIFQIQDWFSIYISQTQILVEPNCYKVNMGDNKVTLREKYDYKSKMPDRYQSIGVAMAITVYAYSNKLKKNSKHISFLSISAAGVRCLSEYYSLFKSFMDLVIF